MDFLNMFRKRLKNCEYPNIESLDDEQVADIFSAENRFFLLTWFAKKLKNSSFEIPNEWSSKTIEIFADFFCEYGFCTPSQKILFVRGDFSLPIEEQLEIFERIFDYIIFSFLAKDTIEPLQDDRDIFPDFVKFLKKDIKLIPTYGPLKPYDPKYVNKQKELYSESIERLRQCLNFDKNSSNSSLNGYNFETLQQYDDGWKEQNILSIKNHALKLKEVASGQSIENESKVDTEIEGFQPNFETNLVECENQVNDIFKYFEDMGLGRKINDTDAITVNQAVENNEIDVLVKQHAQASFEITKLAKKQ